MHRLGCLARVAGLGGVVSAASLLISRQEQQEGRRQQLGQWAQSPSSGLSLNKHLVSNVSAPWGDNVSEEQRLDDEAEEESDLEMISENVTKPNELSKQQAQAEKLKGAINKVGPVQKAKVTKHLKFVSSRPGILCGARCMKVGRREWL